MKKEFWCYLLHYYKDSNTSAFCNYHACGTHCGEAQHKALPLTEPG